MLKSLTPWLLVLLTMASGVWADEQQEDVGAVEMVDARGGFWQMPRPGPEDGPPLTHDLWFCQQKIRWSMDEGPMWYSLGHINRIVTFHRTSGQTHGDRVHVDVYAVDTFDGLTPQAVTHVAGVVIDAGDAAHLETARGWPFPSEVGFDWRVSVLPEREHRSRVQVFMHEDPPIWQTLMVHSEADLGEDRRHFASFDVHILLFEMLHDPAMERVARYRAPKDPPSVTWMHERKVKAPWALGRSRLAFYRGVFHPQAAEHEPFATPQRTQSYTPPAYDPASMPQAVPAATPATPAVDAPSIENLLESGSIDDLLGSPR